MSSNGCSKEVSILTSAVHLHTSNAKRQALNDKLQLSNNKLWSYHASYTRIDATLTSACTSIEFKKYQTRCSYSASLFSDDTIIKHVNERHFACQYHSSKWEKADTLYPIDIITVTPATSLSTVTMMTICTCFLEVLKCMCFISVLLHSSS